MLREEMARTGISGQMFKAGPSFKNVSGPAFLVYYSPAFIRTLAPAHAFEALRVLAEVYRRARGLWPLGKTMDNAHSASGRGRPRFRSCAPATSSAAHGAQSHCTCYLLQVTIRIDQIKELKLPDIQSAFAQGESWLLCRKNDNEALVERHTLEGMAEQAASGVVHSVLKFWR